MLTALSLCQLMSAYVDLHQSLSTSRNSEKHFSTDIFCKNEIWFISMHAYWDDDKQWLLMPEKDRWYKTINDDLWRGILMEILWDIRETDLNRWHLKPTNI